MTTPTTDGSAERQNVTADAGAGRERRKRANGRKAFGVWARRVLVVAGGVAITVAVVLAWLPTPVPVDTATLARGPMRVTVDEDGHTRVRERYVVSAPLAGALARIQLRAGDAVKPEQVLAMLVPLAAPLLDARSRAEADSRELAAEAATRQAGADIMRAKLALEETRRELKRHEFLAGAGSEPAVTLEHAQTEERARVEELSSAEFASQVATHQLGEARAAASRMRNHAPDKGEYVEVRSPTAGVVLRVFQESAGPVQAGAQLLEIGDPTKQEVVVDVLTADAVHITHGARASIERWGGDAPLAGHVRSVEPSAFTKLSALGVEEQRVNVMIDLDAPYAVWAALGDGYRVDAHIIVWETEDTLAAPSGAVFRHGDGWAVYRIEGRAARLRDVTVGRRNGVLVEIQKGLESGDRVILHPSDRVVDDAKVTAR